MKIITNFDNYLLGICTKIAHGFQVLTGKTSFFIAKIGVYITSMATLIEIANYFGQILARETTFVVMVMYSVLNIALLIDAIALNEAEKTHGASKEGVLPSILLLLRSSSDRWRLFWIVFAVKDTFFWHLSANSAKYTWLDILENVLFPYGMVIFYYFVVIDPLSPRKGKIRELVESTLHTNTQPAEVVSGG